MADYQSPVWHPAFEEYCETIFELIEEGVDVIQARIAERLNVSRPAVSEMVKRMEADGLINIDRTITLTDEGFVLAETIVRRHRIAERFLTDILGLSWASAHHEAGKWEHVISPAVEEAMIAKLHDPTTCPHGNPIPGSGYVEPELVSLDTLSIDQEFIVRRIPEALEFSPGMLEFLEKFSITPGYRGTILEVDPGGDTTILIDGETTAVDQFASARILVAIG